MSDLKYSDYNSNYLSAATGLVDGLSTSFDYGGNYNSQDAYAYGEKRGAGVGGAIGAGVGTLLAPVTGGLSIPIGQFLGSKIGGKIGGDASANRAAPILENRAEKQSNFVSMYQDIARHSQISEAQRQGSMFVDDQFRTNLPSL